MCHFRPEEHIDFKAHPIPHPVSPVCTDMVELHFSMEAFEHLEVCNTTVGVCVCVCVCFVISEVRHWHMKGLMI